MNFQIKCSKDRNNIFIVITDICHKTTLRQYHILLKIINENNNNNQMQNRIFIDVNKSKS